MVDPKTALAVLAMHLAEVLIQRNEAAAEVASLRAQLAASESAKPDA